MRQSISALFTRRREGTDETETTSAAVELTDHGIESPVEEAVESSAEEAVESPAEEPVAVAPPESFQFPWTRRQVEEEVGAPADVIPDVAPEEPDAFEAAFDAASESVAEPKSPGFFGRLFGKKAKPEPAENADAVEEIVEEAFVSVDEALPASENAPMLDDFGADVAAAPPPTKRGLFSRVFGKRAPTEPPELDAPEIEVHEDRIEAAAEALDLVGEQQFESFEGKTSAADESFASVDAALPIEAEIAPPIVPVDYSKFAPPAPAAAAPPPEAVDDQPLPFIGDFAPTPASSRPTAEVPASVEQSSRPTFEVPAVKEPEVEASVEQGVFSGDDTLEILEPDSKTDEFEVVTAPVTDDDTVEVEKKNFWTDSFIGKLFRRGDTAVEKVGAKEGAAAEGSAVFLLAKFRAFYNEIIRFQHQKSEFTAGFATAIVTDYAADLSPDAAAEGLSKRLTELLELQAAEAKWMGGEAGERYPDAQYAMAVLADELFSHMEWEGRAGWPKYSIEMKLYRTKAADIEFFKRIDKLLKELPDSVVARDLARVYLLVLGAGFQGKWRPFGLMRPLAEYRRRLYEYIYAGDPLMLYAAERRVFPDTFARTLEGAAVSRFTAMQRWAAILIFLAVSYTVIAHVAWNSVSADLKDVTARIKSNSVIQGGEVVR